MHGVLLRMHRCGGILKIFNDSLCPAKPGFSVVRDSDRVIRDTSVEMGIEAFVRRSQARQRWKLDRR
jgi:hypothetical protein